MVQENSYGHHGCSSSCHSRVHEYHMVVLDVLWQPQVVQLWLASLPARLDEDLTNPGARFNVFYCNLYRIDIVTLICYCIVGYLKGDCPKKH